MSQKTLLWEPLRKLIDNKLNYDETGFSSKKFSFKMKQQDWKFLEKNINKISFKITSSCNSNCKICFDKAFKNQDMDPKNFKSLIKKIGKNKRVLITGGEPTVHPQLMDFLKILHESGNSFGMYTNGLKFSDYSFAKKVRRYCDSLIFSFDGFKPEIYERMRGDENQLQLKLMALKNLKKLDYKVNLSVTVMKGINLNEIPRIIDFAAKNNDFIKNVSMSPAIPFGKFDLEYRNTSCRDIFNEIEEVAVIDYFIEFKKMIDNFSKIARKAGKTIPFGGSLAMVPFSTKDKIKPLIEYDDLKKINKCFSKGNYFELFVQFLKNLKAGRIALPLLFSQKLFQKRMEKENILTIYVGDLNTPLNHTARILDTVCLGLVGDGVYAFSSTLG